MVAMTTVTTTMTSMETSITINPEGRSKTKKRRIMKKIILLFSLLCVAFSATAQSSSSYSSYYLDRMPNAHKLNAALIPEQGGYFAMPILGGFNLTMGGNIGMESFLYQSSTDKNTLNTFMHPDVSGEEAIDNLSKYSGVDFNMEMNLLAVGFTAWGGFNTVDINMQMSGSAYIARDIFAFLKQGETSSVTNYDLSGTTASGKAFAEIALGHARKIGDRLTVGAKVKYIAGMANVYANLDGSTISLSDDEWKIKTVASGNLSVGGLTVDDDGEVDFDLAQIGLAGNGIAFDFGATYRVLDKVSILDGLEVSAAINDLGFITWSGSNTNLSGQGEPFIFSGFDDFEDDIEGQIEDLTSDLENIMSLEMESGAKSYTEMLSVSMTAGAEAIFLDDRITVGVLYTTYMRQGINASHQGTFSLNLKPCRGIQGAVIYSASNYGSNFGGLINFCPRGFNFYLGADYGVPKMTSSFIPVDAKFGLNLSMGMIVSWGEKSRRALRKEKEADN